MAASPNDTVIFPGGTLTDSVGNVWAMADAHVTVNGVADPATINTIAVAWVNGVIWQENSSEVWWQNIVPLTADMTHPSWSPPAVGQTTPPPNLPIAASANDTVITAPGQTITDSGDVQWAINAAGQVTYNGIPDTSTANVTEMAYVNGKIWEKNSAGVWADKTVPSSLWTVATDPLPATNNFSVTDVTTNKTMQTAGTPYTGPVAGLSDEYILVTSDNINVTTEAPNMFISLDGGTGEDAINVSAAGGNNVLNGSTGSSFLVGGSGNDTFFLDDRIDTGPIWSTVSGFHSGDTATIWGVTAADFNITTANNEGATGFTGLTWDFAAAGKPDAKLTLAGLTTADLTNGTVSTSFGTVDGNTYMLVQGT